MAHPANVITEAEYKELLADNAALHIDHDGDEVLLTCPVCTGDGKDPNGDYGCGSCAATGTGRGDPDTSHCRSCGGSGRASKYDPPCSTCDGAGYIYLELSRAAVDQLRVAGKLLPAEPPRAYASNDPLDHCPW